MRSGTRPDAPDRYEPKSASAGAGPRPAAAPWPCAAVPRPGQHAHPEPAGVRVRARVACARNDSSHQACSSNHRHPASSATGRPRHEPDRLAQNPGAFSRVGGSGTPPDQELRHARVGAVAGQIQDISGRHKADDRGLAKEPAQLRDVALQRLPPGPRGRPGDPRSISVRRLALTTSPARSARAATKAVRRSPLIARACPSTVAIHGPEQPDLHADPPGSSLTLSNTVGVALPAGPSCSTVAAPVQHPGQP